MRIFDEVLCVNSEFTEEQKKLIPNRPMKNEVYTIEDILITRNGKGLVLRELVNPPLIHPSGGGTFEASFNVGRFRVLDNIPILQEEDENTMAI